MNKAYINFDSFIEIINQLIPISSIQTILDLGSRDALQAIEFSKRYPKANVFAFECHPGSIQKCLENTRDFSNIKVIEKAVHEINCKCKFYPIDTASTITTWPDGNPGGSSLFLASWKYNQIEKYVQYEIEVEATRLDTWAKEKAITNFDIVWMDLQGAELLALKGMGHLIITVKAIYTEAYKIERYKNQALFPEINNFLTQHNFKLVHAPFSEALFADYIYIRKDLLSKKINFPKSNNQKLPYRRALYNYAKLLSLRIFPRLCYKLKTKEKPNAVIAYLSRSIQSDVDNLKRSLQLLDKNFNDRFHYPVIIFHEDFDTTLMQEIRKSTHSSIGFEKVEFQIPDFLNKNEILKKKLLGRDIGYRHMCRFFSGLIFRHPAMKDYNWYWRLDTDSFLLGKINYDVFLFMQKRGYKYGYMVMLKDNPCFAEGLWDATKKYIEENAIKPKFLRDFLQNGEYDLSYYYTNLEISKLDFWRSDEYNKYFDYLDRCGGIYKYRWGDALIHTLAVSMFMDKRHIYKFENIRYKHNVYVNSPSWRKALYRFCSKNYHFILEEIRK